MASRPVIGGEGQVQGERAPKHSLALNTWQGGASSKTTYTNEYADVYGKVGFAIITKLNIVYILETGYPTLNKLRNYYTHL